ncbi:MAG: FUSC family protein, partial [Planctomycetales bacterium]
MKLAPRFSKRDLQDALKLSVSLVLFYWLALSSNWQLAKYGALAIVLISLGPTDASLRKGLLRIAGTTVGIAVGFFLAAAFAQDRWATMLFIASYVVATSYFMLGSRYAYAWFVAGFVPAIVWSDTYMKVDQVFYFGTFRYQETVIGVAIYALVCMVLWPRDSESKTSASPPKKQTHGLRWDPERFGKACLPGLSFIAAFFFWIVMDPPLGPHIPMMAVVLAMMILLTKANPLTILYLLVGSIVFAVAPVYLFVMPKLSGGELFLLVFVYSFFFSLIGSRLPTLKTVPLLVFVMMTGISNQQTYSFIGLVNGAMMFVMAQSIIIMVSMLCIPKASPIHIDTC